MTEWAKDVNNKLVHPTAAEFRGIPNWILHEPMLRSKGYMPTVGEPEEQEGYEAIPATWHVVPQSMIRVEPRREDPITHEPFMEDVYEEDPVTHEQVKTGERPVTRTVEITFDKSYIQIDTWTYEPIPAPEPEPEPDTTERDNAEKAIVGAIKAMAIKYNALNELANMQDITIPNLEALADAKGVPYDEFGALITMLTPYKWQLEAVTGMVWADCWTGLKSRFMRWMQEVN